MSRRPGTTARPETAGARGDRGREIADLETHHHDHDSEAFLTPDHDHGPCAGSVIERAEKVCRERGVKLTTQRRAVLEALVANHKPAGAYDIIERLGAGGPPPAPISVYRALGFLTENGLAHRIERLNAFVACDGHHDAARPVVFLICETCGQVAEIAAAEIGIDLAGLSAKTGFVPHTAAIEISGLCSHCAGAAAA
ncbi:ferric uptake regulator, Fur family [Pseudoxanthobacter soli DSM 19599]|uniref:Ferric uptake regulator, Fur family n=1 Tax=Pseudoxanthobacter soli DSM 19599 TaxID=1123029 RepID=A0A1M7ZK10_9HYPH|nr:ferric uptake regulator, Fur family [Pseudoxanthobacter soli DSM 19599]